MATQMKRLALLFVLALFSATFFSSVNALNLRGFGGAPKLLNQLNANTFAAAQEAGKWSSKTVSGSHAWEALDYGPPGSNPPYHEDPPSPFTMTSPGELKSVETAFDLRVDSAPVGTSTPDYDNRPAYRESSKIENVHTDYVPAETSPGDYDYPPPGIWSLKAVNIHTDYIPATTSPPISN